MTIYMDACCLNRPFDDQTQDKIRIESDAILAILSYCLSGEWQLISSEVLDYEIDSMLDKWKKSKVKQLCKLATDKIVLNDIIKKRAIELQTHGIKAFDSLHLASAEHTKVDVFLTTDRKLLNAAIKLNMSIIIANPLNWFMEVDGNE